MEQQEKTFNWEDLTDLQITQLVAAHKPVCSDTDTLKRIFALGRPKIVFGPDYCRIHKDSVDVIKILINNYGIN